MSSDDSFSNQIQTYLFFPGQFFCQRPHFTPPLPPHTHTTKYFQLYGVTFLYVFPLVVHRIVLRFLLQFFLVILFSMFQVIRNENKELFPTIRTVRLLLYGKYKIFHFIYNTKKSEQPESTKRNHVYLPNSQSPDDIIGTKDC